MNKKEWPIYPGDSVQVETMGITIRGFLLSEFMTTRTVGSDSKPTVLAWFVMNEKKEIFCTDSYSSFKNTRIVLTEKIKNTFRLNKDYELLLSQAQARFRNHTASIKLRQTGSTAWAMHYAWEGIKYPSTTTMILGGKSAVKRDL